MDVTNMSLYLGRTAYQPTKVDKEIIIEIIKENERRKSLKKEKYNNGRQRATKFIYRKNEI